MDRDLNFPFNIPSPGRHQFLVIIPDKPEDFPGNNFNIGSWDGTLRNFQLTDVGNGEQGFIIGAQNIEVRGQNRLIAQAFNPADTAAATEYFSNQSGPYDPSQYQCELPTDYFGNPENDSEIIMSLLENITNYNENEKRQNIPYPGNGALVDDLLGNDGAVNSNSWALSALDSLVITPENTDFPGMDLLNENRIDPDYFTYGPDINDLTVENTDTDGDGDLDARDTDDDGDGVPDDSDAWPIDSSRS